MMEFSLTFEVVAVLQLLPTEEHAQQICLDLEDLLGLEANFADRAQLGFFFSGQAAGACSRTPRSGPSAPWLFSPP